MDILLPFNLELVVACVVFFTPSNSTYSTFHGSSILCSERGEKKKSTPYTDEIYISGFPSTSQRAIIISSFLVCHLGDRSICFSLETIILLFLTDLKYLQSALYFVPQHLVLKEY